MIRLFASDLDGTLLNLTHSLDGAIRAAIREVTDSGAHFAIATGRTMGSNGDYGFEGLGVEAIASNGALIFDRDGRLIKHSVMDPAFLEEMFRAFPQVCFECVGVGRSYVMGSMEEQQAGFDQGSPAKRLLMRGMSMRRAEMQAMCSFDQTPEDVLAHEICKVNARVTDPAIEAELHAFLAEHADSVVNTPFDPVMFEISGIDTNKGSAVAWLAGYLGCSEDEVAVYGDGGNDVAMLERFEHSYATSNARDEAKEAASEVIGPCALHAVPRHMVRTIHSQRAYTQIE